MTHLGTRKRKYRLKGVEKAANQLTFHNDREGRDMTVADYFEKQYQNRCAEPPFTNSLECLPFTKEGGRSNPLACIFPTSPTCRLPLITVPGSDVLLLYIAGLMRGMSLVPFCGAGHCYRPYTADTCPRLRVDFLPCQSQKASLLAEIKSVILA